VPLTAPPRAAGRWAARRAGRCAAHRAGCWAGCWAGIAAGIGLDVLFADPRRLHPVAGFGRLAAAAERVLYRDSRAAGVAHTALCVGGVAVGGTLLARAAGRLPEGEAALLALSVWTALGGSSLRRHGRRLGVELGRGDLPAARRRLPALCGRDPAALDDAGLARAGVESVAENTSDAVVAPLVWAAAAGVPGVLAYRAVNTLDAMVGYRDVRYGRFGTAAARLDDAANLLPARLTAALACLCAPAVGGDAAAAWAVLRRDGGAHPSPNAGRPEAAFAGAMRLRLGGPLRYPHGLEPRPTLGTGAPPTAADLARAARLSAVVGAAAGMLTAAAAAVLARPANREAASGAAELAGRRIANREAP